MQNISTNVLSFLKDLNKNNNREWFAEHKPRYVKAHADFTDFIGELIKRIAVFEPAVGQLEAKKAVFRIYRDTRFSKDKTPYKINMGAHLTPGGNKSGHENAGYYIHIQPGNSFLAGGAYLPPGPWIKAIRQEIAYNTKEFKSIINGKDFKKYFGELEGEKLKTAPQGYSTDHPEIELLRLKSLLAVHNLKDAEITRDGFLDHCEAVFRVLQPFDQFLNKAKD